MLCIQHNRTSRSAYRCMILCTNWLKCVQKASSYPVACGFQKLESGSCTGKWGPWPAGCMWTGLRLWSFGRIQIQIQISDPSDPSESTEHFFADLGCCHVDEVKNGADRSPKKGISRTDRPRRTKSQQKSTRRTTMSIKMIFTHHIRTKVTFGSDGSSQPCSRSRVARIQIRRIWIRIRPIDHCRSSGSDGSGSGSDQTITA